MKATSIVVLRVGLAVRSKVCCLSSFTFLASGGESHFSLLIVSERFEGLNLIERHRLVNKILKTELNGGLHALCLLTLSPSEWKSDELKNPFAPSCQQKWP
ncbi:unnamed protein product [Soboliphyme baturini]|uniref:BolA-like protein 1 n=1 Tax=Soboliphyme baturini TaxID=241478 RepID=A0A183IGU5_9BILA|nr:unnamed protein product [Soboliphyme baturini]